MAELRWAAVLCRAAVLGAWACLLLVSIVAPGAVPPRWLLCGVTVLAALSCWVRVCLVRERRAAWAALAVGLSGYGGGFVVLFFVTSGEGGGPFGLNWSDSASLVLYPAAYTGIVLLVRASVRQVQRTAVLDGTLLALAGTALALAIANRINPALLEGGGLAVVYALAYVVGGAVLLLAALTGVALDRFRIDRVWALLLLGFLAWTIGDGLYGLQAVWGGFRFGTPVDAVYTLGPVLVSVAAWAPVVPETGPRPANRPLLMVVPAVSTLVALGVLVDRDPGLPLVCVVLAAAAIVTAVLRAGLFVRREHRLQLRAREAHVDDATGLTNRRGLLAAIGEVPPGSTCGLLLVDVPVLDRVRDAHGHAGGEAVLVELAGRMSRGPGSVVARTDGDLLALLLPGVDADGTQRAVEQLREAVEAPLLVERWSLHASATVGLAVRGTAVGGGPEAPESVLRRARVALDEARRAGVHALAWLPLHDLVARERLELVSELTDALGRDGELVVHLQTKHEPGSRRVVGMEALVRWEHPVRGTVLPDRFVDLAETAGLLVALTGKVLETALAHTATLRAQGLHVPVSVNVGAADLLDRRFPGRVGAALERHGLPVQALRLEITENVVMSDPRRVLQTLEHLRHLGVGLSLDDYGTGLASLSYLKSLPVDELKIDRSFITRMCVDPSDALIVASTVAMAHGLGLTVVAEGVEDEPTLARLAELGCDEVQGYLLGRPVPVDELVTWLRTRAPAPAEVAGHR